MERFVIFETLADDGARAETALVRDEGGLSLELPPSRHPLPPAYVAAVMRRYGKALEPAYVADAGPRFDLGDGASIARLRHLARYDVIARDFLVYFPPEGEPLCELATGVSAALAHLARANG